MSAQVWGVTAEMRVRWVLGVPEAKVAAQCSKPPDTPVHAGDVGRPERGIVPRASNMLPKRVIPSSEVLTPTRLPKSTASVLAPS